MLTAKVDNPHAGLRLAISSPGHFALTIDVENPGDQVVEYEGSKVLLVEQGLAASLEEVTLDVEGTPEGPKLAIFRES